MPSHAHVHGAARRGVLDRVVDHNEQHLLQSVGVRFDDRRLRLGVQRQLNSGVLGQQRRPPHHFGGEVGQLQRRGHQLEPAGVGAGQSEQVLRQALHARDLSAHVVEQLAFAFDGLISMLVQQVGRRSEDRQRRTQLVRGISDEFLLASERLLNGNQGATRQKPCRG